MSNVSNVSDVSLVSNVSNVSDVSLVLAGILVCYEIPHNWALL